MVWQFKLDKRLHKDSLRISSEGPTACKSFSNSKGMLAPMKQVEIREGTNLSRTIVELPQKTKDDKLQLALITKPGDQIALINQFKWVDGKSLFDSNTHHLR